MAISEYTRQSPKHLAYWNGTGVELADKQEMPDSLLDN